MTSQDVAEGISPPQDPARRWPVIGVACIVALLFGLVLPFEPKAAVAAVVLVPLAFAAPTAALSVLLAVTILVPFDTQDSLAVFGGRETPGLLIVDVMMLLGVVRITWLVLRGRFDLDRRVLAGYALAAIVAVSFVWGLVLGATPSGSGHEARRLLMGCGAFLMALPLVDDSTARRRLSYSLMGIGMAVGLWGLAQWVLQVPYTTSGDVGVRPGVDLTSSGHGQLQGGMYAFPIVVILTWAALVAGRYTVRWIHWTLIVILLLNGMCLILTFERSLWGGAVLGCAVVAFTSGPEARRSGLKWAAAGLVGLVLVAAVSPRQARTAVERLLSIAQVQTDTSFTSRVVESRAVSEATSGRPFTGSGLGATITWGQQDTFATVTTPFSHNGYLWLAWKIGVPAAVFVVAVIVAAILRRSRGDESPQWRALRRGSQASLAALLVIGMVFPPFNVLGITAAMGFLAAVCCSKETT